MSDKRILKKPSVGNGIKFVFYPIAFFLLGFMICYFSFSSILESYDNFLNIFISSNAPDFSKNKENLMEHAEENGKIALPEEHQQFGILKIDSAGIDANVFYGDDAEELLKGVGCSREGHIPGQRSTILLGAHNNTFFHSLDKVKEGDKVEFTTNYGHYIYEVTGTKVTLHTDESAYDLYRDKENLIMYTCYPLDELRLTPQRLFVYAKYVSGPQKQEY